MLHFVTVATYLWCRWYSVEKAFNPAMNRDGITLF